MVDRTNHQQHTKCDITLISLKTLSHHHLVALWGNVRVKAIFAQSQNKVSDREYQYSFLARNSRNENDYHTHSLTPTLLPNSILAHMMCDVNRNLLKSCKRVEQRVEQRVTLSAHTAQRAERVL